MDWSFIFLGGVMGLVYALTGWSTSSRVTDLKENPRVKNLIWAVITIVIILLIDPKIISVIGNIDKVAAFSGYTISFVLACVLCIIFNGIIIWQRQGDMHAALDYAHRGYDFYKEKYADAAAAVVSIHEIIKSNANHLTLTTKAVFRYLDAPDPAHQQTIINNILIAIYSVAVSYLRHSDGVNVNYMIAKRYCDTSEGERGFLHFTGKVGDLTHVLVLRGYAIDHHTEEGFALGVPRNKKEALPGAPTAYMNSAEDVVSCVKSLAKMPKNVKNEMKGYWNSKKFRSFLSLAIPCDYGVVGERVRVGVINIECARDDFFSGAKEDYQKAFIAATEPYAVLLGKVLERSLSQEFAQ